MGNSRNNTNIIDMNGKRYDAVSGAYLGEGLAPAAKHTSVHSVRSRGTSVDGFTKVKHGMASPALSPQPLTKKPLMQYATAPHTAAAAHPLMPTSQRPAHAPGVHATPHTPQRATTLMRSAVSKPVIKSPAMLKAQSRTDVLAKIPMQTVATKMSYNSINPVRHRRAERMMQSPAISRYGKGTGQAASSQTVYKVAPQPEPISRPAPTYRGGMPHQVTDLRQVSPVAPGRPLRPTAAPIAIPAPRAAATPVSASHPSSHHDDIFEKALAEAKSHEEKYDARNHKTHRRGRGLRFFAGGLVLLFIAGFLVYQNAPNLSLTVASYRSGLHAKLPAKQPTGFTLGYLDYQPGNVTANFTSQDSRQFNIKQKASNWDSQALLSNFVSSANSAYKTYQQAGRTVYLIGNNTATWVDSGVWYTVDGNSSLSAKQLLDVAGSM